MPSNQQQKGTLNMATQEDPSETPSSVIGKFISKAMVVLENVRAGDFAGVSQDLLFRRQLECYLVASHVLSAARIRVPDGLHFKCSGSGASRPDFNGWQQV
jgi:hypothetical protein